MVYEPEVTDQEAIRHQMEETRASLADKLESLEQHVLGTVHETTSAVSGTVEKVTEAVEGTVESVKETVANVKETVRDTFDLRLQTERHPWTVVGGSVAVGFAAGYLMPRLLERLSGAEANGSEWEPVPTVFAARTEPEPERPSFFKQPLFAQVIEPELARLKNYAVESLKGMVHDFIARSVPGYDDERGRNGSDELMHSQ